MAAMGESASFLPAAYSYASAVPAEPCTPQGNPIRTLGGGSVSFGRFMSESLDWEKWSTFSHNRYVEEAERYAQPGSVAQKKAFFEAHYKRIAAKKAAALLEQANAANNTSPEPESDTGGGVTDVNASSISDSRAVIFYSRINSKDQQEDKETEVLLDSVAAAGWIGRSNLEAEPPQFETINAQADKCTTERTVENLVKDELSNLLEYVDNRSTVSVSEPCGIPHTEKHFLQLHSLNSDRNVSLLMSKKKPVLSPLKSPSVCPTASKVEVLYTTLTPRCPSKENVAPAPCKSAADSREYKTTQSLGSLINFNPSKEPDKLTTPFLRKTRTSGVARISNKESSCPSTLLRTPTKANVKGQLKYPSTTPSSESTRQPVFHKTLTSFRAKTPLDPALGSKTTGPKWHLVSAAVTKSLQSCRNKLWSPSLSTPFTLRTEQRAAKRKQKLEAKFNAEKAGKVHMQTKLKEKAETEARKLSQSFCFKARPLPAFYREKETQNQMKVQKVPTHPHTQKPGRKLTNKGMQANSSDQK